MRDAVDPWRVGDLVYLEREINYWAGSKAYAACAAGVQDARTCAAKHGMDRVAVLPAWAARYEGRLQDIVARIDPDGRVMDCAGAEIVVMPTTTSLDQFVQWCRQHVTWA
jgi:hypothetical protein